MRFRKTEILPFKKLFKEVQIPIQSCNGCISVKLLQSKDDPQLMFTLSKWDDDQDLENYRQSELFKSTWKKTKQMFEDKAEAWTLEDC